MVLISSLVLAEKSSLKQPCQFTSCGQVRSSEIYSHYNARECRRKKKNVKRQENKREKIDKNVKAIENSWLIIIWIFPTRVMWFSGLQRSKTIIHKFKKLSGNFGSPQEFQQGQKSLTGAFGCSLRWRQVRWEIKQRKGIVGKEKRNWGGGKGGPSILPQGTKHLV